MIPDFAVATVSRLLLLFGKIPVMGIERNREMKATKLFIGPPAEVTLFVPINIVDVAEVP